jgi:hypothetical protein
MWKTMVYPYSQLTVVLNVKVTIALHATQQMKKGQERGSTRAAVARLQAGTTPRPETNQNNNYTKKHILKRFLNHTILKKQKYKKTL